MTVSHLSVLKKAVQLALDSGNLSPDEKTCATDLASLSSNDTWPLYAALEELGSFDYLTVTTDDIREHLANSEENSESAAVSDLAIWSALKRQTKYGCSDEDRGCIVDAVCRFYEEEDVGPPASTMTLTLSVQTGGLVSDAEYVAGAVEDALRGDLPLREALGVPRDHQAVVAVDVDDANGIVLRITLHSWDPNSSLDVEATRLAVEHVFYQLTSDGHGPNQVLNTLGQQRSFNFAAAVQTVGGGATASA